MKKILVIILFLFLFFYSFSQHEGIKRYFNTYTMQIIPKTDNYYQSDTTTDNFHLYLPYYKKTKLILGSPLPGSPYMSPNYFLNEEHDFVFFKDLSCFVKKHEDIIYFDARKPFTAFNFYSGGAEREFLKLVHTQNINPFFNFVFNYDIINWKGNYQHSRSKVHALNLASSYTKRKYQSHFNFIFNRLNLHENGGIQNVQIFENNKLPANNLSVNLYNAAAKMHQLGFQYHQEYKFGTYLIDTIYKEKDTTIIKKVQSNFSLMHDFSADRYYRVYQDLPSSFYSNIYIDSLQTYDSLSSYILHNKFLVKFNLLKEQKAIKAFNLIAGLHTKFNTYSFNVDKYSLINMSNYVLAKAYIEGNKLDMNLNFNYCFVGYNNFDTEIKANLLYHLKDNLQIKAQIGYQLLKPNEFYFYYKSNHFAWDNNNFKQKQELKFISSIELSNINLSLGLSGSVINNYLVFDKQCVLMQITKPNIVASFFVNKIFKFGNFVSSNELMYQYIKDAYTLPLPNFIAYSSLYYKALLLNKKLSLQLGVDLKYFSKSYTYSYMPALSAFYLQDYSTIGNYPKLSFFIVSKIKRFRVFARVDNFNSLFMKSKYYTLYQVPDNPFSFSYGISWEFYD